MTPATIDRGPSPTLEKERTLLSRPWRALRTPRVLATGDDFLVLEHLELSPLPATAGAAVGRALAEIHAIRYPETGVLAGDLSIATIFPPDGFGFGGYVRAGLSEAEPFLDRSLPPRIRAHLVTIAEGSAPHAHRRARRAAYRDGGGVLVEGWRRFAATIDLGSLLFVYAHNPIMRTTDEIPRRIAQTLDAG